MVARPVDQTETESMEVNVPGLEIVHYTTQSTAGDFYDTKKLANIKGAFASNVRTADSNIQVSWAINAANGQMRVTLVPEANDTEGYLVIIGRK